MPPPPHHQKQQHEEQPPQKTVVSKVGPGVPHPWEVKPVKKPWADWPPLSQPPPPPPLPKRHRYSRVFYPVVDVKKVTSKLGLPPVKCLKPVEMPWDKWPEFKHESPPPTPRPPLQKLSRLFYPTVDVDKVTSKLGVPSVKTLKPVKMPWDEWPEFRPVSPHPTPRPKYRRYSKVFYKYPRDVKNVESHLSRMKIPKANAVAKMKKPWSEWPEKEEPPRSPSPPRRRKYSKVAYRLPYQTNMEYVRSRLNVVKPWAVAKSKKPWYNWPEKVEESEPEPEKPKRRKYSKVDYPLGIELGGVHSRLGLPPLTELRKGFTPLPWANWPKRRQRRRPRGRPKPHRFSQVNYSLGVDLAKVESRLGLPKPWELPPSTPKPWLSWPVRKVPVKPRKPLMRRKFVNYPLPDVKAVESKLGVPRANELPPAQKPWHSWPQRAEPEPEFPSKRQRYSKTDYPLPATKVESKLGVPTVSQLRPETPKPWASWPKRRLRGPPPRPRRRRYSQLFYKYPFDLKKVPSHLSKMGIPQAKGLPKVQKPWDTWPQFKAPPAPPPLPKRHRYSKVFYRYPRDIKKVVSVFPQQGYPDPSHLKPTKKPWDDWPTPEWFYSYRYPARWTAPETYPPCPHLHFRTRIIPREYLTPREQFDLLATPKGYRWYQKSDHVMRRIILKMPAKKVKKPKPPPAGFRQFMFKIWEMLSPEMIYTLKDILEEELEMKPEEAVDFLIDQREKARQLAQEEMYGPAPHITGLDIAWARRFAGIISDKITSGAELTGLTPRTKRTKKLETRLREGLHGLAGLKDNGPSTPLREALYRLSDFLSCWLAYLPGDLDLARAHCRSLQPVASQVSILG